MSKLYKFKIYMGKVHFNLLYIMSRGFQQLGDLAWEGIKKL